MLAAERRNLILEKLQDEKKVIVSELGERSCSYDKALETEKPEVSECWRQREEI